jgi:hypothetical protein
MTSKATPSRRKQRRCCRHRSSEESKKCFHTEDTNQSRKHPNTPPPRRATTPEDAADVDADTIAGKAFARRFVQCRPCPTRGKTVIDWKSPDIHRGTPKDGSNPPQQPTTTDTALHANEPPLHLGHEIGPHVSARPTEVANHHRPPPKLAPGAATRDQNLPGT